MLCFPTFFGAWHPYLVLKIYGKTLDRSNRYKDKINVSNGDIPATHTRQTSVTRHPGWETLPKWSGNTVKLVYNDHPRDPELVAVVVRWPLFRGNFMLQYLKMGLQNGGRYRQVVVIRRWSLAQV